MCKLHLLWPISSYQEGSNKWSTVTSGQKKDFLKSSFASNTLHVVGDDRSKWILWHCRQKRARCNEEQQSHPLHHARHALQKDFMFELRMAHAHTHTHTRARARARARARGARARECVKGGPQL